MKITLTTKIGGFKLVYYDTRDVIYIEKFDNNTVSIQWYDEDTGYSDNRLITDIATIELSND